MLSRASSDAGTRLRRSKSTSTVYSPRASAPEPFDANIAQQHALAAATTAFVRAHAVDKVEKTHRRTAELARSKSNASRKSQGSHFPPRGSSLLSIHSQSVGQPPQRMIVEKFPPFHMTPSTLSASSQPSTTSNENMRPSSQPKSLRPATSVSMASQQIRKARSMYYASSVQTGSPLARPPTKYLTTPPVVSPAPNSPLLSIPSSDGQFRRPRSSAVSPLVSPCPPVAIIPGEAVNKARDKYLRDFQQQHQVKHKPSLLLAPFKKRQDKGKTKSGPFSSEVMLSGSEHAPAKSTLSVAQLDFKPQKEKRTLSDSLRQKFKKVFRRTSNKAIDLPVQQVEATRDYFSPDAPQSVEVEDPVGVKPNLKIRSPHEDTLHNIQTRSPSFGSGRLAYIRSSSRGSNRSLHSDTGISNINSRVTSWSSSSASGGTLTQRDIKRLTVIHEAKDSIGSDVRHIDAHSSPIRKPPPLLGLAAFRDPMPMDSLLEESSTPVDPKRVFSALMKEIDASKSTQSPEGSVHQVPDTESDVFISTTPGELHSGGNRGLYSGTEKEFRISASSDAQRSLSILRPESACNQSKASLKANSLKSLRRAFKATIRSVTPSGPTSSPLSDHTTTVCSMVRIPASDTTESSSNTIIADPGDQGEGSLSSVNFQTQQTMKMPEDPCAPYVTTPTADQIESRVQKSRSRWTTPLEGDHVSLFRPNKGTLTMTNFTRMSTTQESSMEDLSRTSSRETACQEITQTPRGNVSALLMSPKPKSLFSPLSPSIYSRNTDGVSIHPADSVMSLDNAEEDNNDKGAAIITTSRAVKSYFIGSTAPQPPTQSTRSSRDWKAWLSHEVSELGSSSHENISIQEEFDTPPTGHLREFTQIAAEHSTPTVHELEGSPASAEAQSGAETHLARDSPNVISKMSKDWPDAPARSSSSHCTVTTRYSQLANTKDQRAPTVQCDFYFSGPRAKGEARPSARMNERFPFIETGRRSSSNSARQSSHTPSLPESGSSSLRSDKATPNSKVYSDFSVPSSNRNSKREPNICLKRVESEDSRDEHCKENITPPAASNNTTRAPQSPSKPMSRPKSLQPFNITPNNGFPSLSQYITPTETVKLQPRMTTVDPTLPRTRLRIRPVSPTKLTTRAKSAFELRETSTSPLTQTPLHTRTGDSPRKRVLQSKSAIGCDPESGAFATNVRSSRSAGTPSPGRSAADLNRPILHLKHSSSTLALNKEPSPGAEERGIDSVLTLGEDEKGNYPLPKKGGGSVTPSQRTGSVTPGQKMADRFLRERKAGSGAGSPISDVSSEDENQSVSIRSRTCSPAFI